MVAVRRLFAHADPALPFGAPRLRHTLTGVRSVAADGEYQGVAIRTDGSVWAWGYRGFVDCAAGTLASTPFQIANAANITAVSAGQDHTLLLRNDKAVLAYGCNGNRQLGQSSQQVPPMSPAMVVAGLPPIKAVAAGAESSLALDEAGEVWAWGRKPGDRSASSASNATPTKGGRPVWRDRYSPG